MSDIQIMERYHESAKSIGETIRQIKEEINANLVKDVIDKIYLARQWAKLRNEIEKSRADLLRLEIECFVRLFDLNATNLIRGKYELCRFFNSHKHGIESLLKEFPECATAQQIYNSYLRKETKAEGSKFALGNSPAAKNDFNQLVASAAIDFHSEKKAMNFLLDKYASDNEQFTIAKMADEFIAMTSDEPITITEAFTQGIREVCRNIVNTGNWDEMGAKKVPRFVTCLSNDGKTIVRIPFENAKLFQLKEMITIRAEKLRQFQIAMDNLGKIYGELLDFADGKEDDERTIGKIIELNA